MIKFIEITNQKDEVLRLELTNADTGFYVKEIKGLEPVRANVTTSDIVTGDGATFNSSRAEKRNIVMSLGFLPNEGMDSNTIELIRHKCYKFFPIKQKIKFYIETDTRQLYTYGYIESNEPSIFDEQEGAEISIICPEAFFKSTEERDEVMNQIIKKFHFKFAVELEEVTWKDIADPTIQGHVPIITETGTTDTFNGNDRFELYIYRSNYGELQKFTYSEFNKITYAEMQFLRKN